MTTKNFSAALTTEHMNRNRALEALAETHGIDTSTLTVYELTELLCGTGAVRAFYLILCDRIADAWEAEQTGTALATVYADLRDWLAGMLGSSNDAYTRIHIREVTERLIEPFRAEFS